jgi:hypothetical protein
MKEKIIEIIEEIEKIIEKGNNHVYSECVKGIIYLVFMCHKNRNDNNQRDIIGEECIEEWMEKKMKSGYEVVQYVIENNKKIMTREMMNNNSNLNDYSGVFSLAGSENSCVFKYGNFEKKN